MPELPEWLAYRAAQMGDRVAVLFEDGAWTFRDLDRRAAAVACRLSRLGVGPGDRVALLVPNGPAFVELVFGVARLGAVLVPLNVRLSAPELAWQLADARPQLLVFDTETKDLARQTLPPTIVTSFSGTAQAFQASMKGMGLLLILSVLVIYLVLGILYESFIHPVTILTALPFAGFGALLTLLVFNTELTLYAYVGIIMLVGLVKKNGIMMVDFAIEEQKTGKEPVKAIYDACLVRFRPIMMTTFAALMAGLPIALGFGAGAESRRPLGLAVVGGLIFSQSLTLYVTPVFYTYMEQLRGWKGRKGAGAEATNP